MSATGASDVPVAQEGEPLEPALYVVSTPIGNLEDITVRALNVLSRVDLIAAEDTRTTGNLLKHYNISKPLLSYYSYNEFRRTPELISKLESGHSIAIVSDAGTPGISDPAYHIVRAALEHNIRVIAIPGASAILPAVTASGLPAEHFIYDGFLPVKKGRKTKLEGIRDEPYTVVLYESPHRIMRTLNDILTIVGDRDIAIARELTKKFEEIFRGKVSEAVEHFTKKAPRGEFVIVVAPNSSPPA